MMEVEHSAQVRFILWFMIRRRADPHAQRDARRSMAGRDEGLLVRRDCGVGAGCEPGGRARPGGGPMPAGEPGGPNTVGGPQGVEGEEMVRLIALDAEDAAASVLTASRLL